MQPVSLFGKMRSAGDFVGLHGEPGASAVQRWMQRAHELAGGASLAEPVYFVAAFPGARDAFCGAWIASADRVGRRFPLLAFLPLAAELAGLSRGYLPPLVSPYLDRLVAIMMGAPDASFRELEAALREVPAPDPALLPCVVERCGQECRRERVSSFVQRVLQGDAGQLAYALHAVALACEPLRPAPPEQADIALDCPVVIDLDLFFWADLVHRSLRWRGEGPGLFWTERAPRLLTTLGPAAPVALCQLTTPETCPSAWPLWTQRHDARERAQRSLAGEVRKVLEDDASLHALGECF